jgi:uncharacterized protein (DUF486 family)
VAGHLDRAQILRRCPSTLRSALAERPVCGRNLAEFGDGPRREDCMPTAYWTPIALLIASNVFMTTAWYGQFKFPHVALLPTILISWGIAFVEYCLAVPANKIGHTVYSAAELKTMQEVITLVVFSAFSIFVLKEALTWKHAVGFSLIAIGAAVVFYKPN